MDSPVIVTVMVSILACAQSAFASGHGPVFGAATPTLGRGEWSLDEVWTARFCSADAPSDQMLRTMIGYGITENVQVSVSVPMPLSTGPLFPARMMGAMSSTTELEGLVGWRFQRRDVGVGGRQESTVYVGGSVPLTGQVNGIALGPSLYASAATGYASRSHYLWFGGGLQQYASRNGDRIGSSRFVSLVYGYRPALLRLEYPKPDLRFFAEAVIEHRTDSLRQQMTVSSAANTAFVGPTFLLLYKAYGVSGGVQFPAYSDMPSTAPHEQVRLALNATYFFLPR